MNMKVYTCTKFQGYWPVGTSAVIVANDRAHALRLLEAEAETKGLTGAADNKGTPLSLDDFVLVPTDHANAIILNDGNY